MTDEADRALAPKRFIRTLDADTLKVGDERVRLTGTQAPELGTPQGPAAAAALDRLRQSGGYDQLERQGRDLYGRTVGDLQNAQGGSLAEASVAAGLAPAKDFNGSGTPHANATLYRAVSRELAGEENPLRRAVPESAVTRFLGGLAVENRKRTLPAELAAGVSRGTDNLQAGLYGAVAALGAATGLRSLEATGQRGHLRNVEQAAKRAATTTLKDAEGIDGHLRWAAGVLGEALPSVGVMAAGGAGGGALGAVARAAIAKSTQRQVARSLTRNLSQLGVRPITAARVSKKLFADLPQYAAAVGAGGASAAIEAGHTFEDIQQAYGIQSPFKAAAQGLASGALDAVGAGVLLTRLFKGAGDEAMGGVRRLAQETGIGVLVEGTTEAAQELTNIVAVESEAPDWDGGLDTLLGRVFSQQNQERIVEAGAAGMLFGGVFGAGGAAANATVKRLGSSDDGTREEGAEPVADAVDGDVGQAAAFEPIEPQAADSQNEERRRDAEKRARIEQEVANERYASADQAEREAFAKKLIESEGLDEASAARIARHVDAGRDDLTGFKRKSHRDETVKLAIDHVGQGHGDTGFYVEADIRNLGGVNNALGNSGANVPFKRMTQIFAEEVGKLGGDIRLFRHGGDEIGAVVVGSGLTQDQVTAALASAQGRVAEYVQSERFQGRDGGEVDLSQIEHPKHPGEDSFRGTGISFGITEIRSGDDRDSVLRRADVEVELQKGIRDEQRVETAPAGAGQGQTRGTTPSAGTPARGAEQAPGASPKRATASPERVAPPKSKIEAQARAAERLTEKKAKVETAKARAQEKRTEIAERRAVLKARGHVSSNASPERKVAANDALSAQRSAERPKPAEKVATGSVVRHSAQKPSKTNNQALREKLGKSEPKPSAGTPTTADITADIEAIVEGLDQKRVGAPHPDVAALARAVGRSEKLRLAIVKFFEHGAADIPGPDVENAVRTAAREVFGKNLASADAELEAMALTVNGIAGAKREASRARDAEAALQVLLGIGVETASSLRAKLIAKLRRRGASEQQIAGALMSLKQSPEFRAAEEAELALEAQAQDLAFQEASKQLAEDEANPADQTKGDLDHESGLGVQAIDSVKAQPITNSKGGFPNTAASFRTHAGKQVWAKYLKNMARYTLFGATDPVFEALPEKARGRMIRRAKWRAVRGLRSRFTLIPTWETGETLDGRSGTRKAARKPSGRFVIEEEVLGDLGGITLTLDGETRIYDDVVAERVQEAVRAANKIKPGTPEYEREVLELIAHDTNGQPTGKVKRLRARDIAALGWTLTRASDFSSGRELYAAEKFLLGLTVLEQSPERLTLPADGLANLNNLVIESVDVGATYAEVTFGQAVAAFKHDEERSRIEQLAKAAKLPEHLKRKLEEWREAARKLGGPYWEAIAEKAVKDEIAQYRAELVQWMAKKRQESAHDDPRESAQESGESVFRDDGELPPKRDRRGSTFESEGLHQPHSFEFLMADGQQPGRHTPRGIEAPLDAKGVWGVDAKDPLRPMLEAMVRTLGLSDRPVTLRRYDLEGLRELHKLHRHANPELAAALERQAERATEEAEPSAFALIENAQTVIFVDQRLAPSRFDLLTKQRSYGAVDSKVYGMLAHEFGHVLFEKYVAGDLEAAGPLSEALRTEHRKSSSTLDLEEWFAEEVAKWMRNNQQAVHGQSRGLIAAIKGFIALVRRLLAKMNAYRGKRRPITVEEVVNTIVARQYLRARRRETQTVRDALAVVAGDKAPLVGSDPLYAYLEDVAAFGNPAVRGLVMRHHTKESRIRKVRAVATKKVKAFVDAANRGGNLFGRALKTSDAWLRSQRNAYGEGIDAMALFADLWRSDAGVFRMQAHTLKWRVRAWNLKAKKWEVRTESARYRVLDDEPMFQAIRRKTGHFESKVLAALKGLDEKQQRAVMEELRAKRSEQSAAGKALREVLDSVHAYMNEKVKRASGWKGPRIGNGVKYREHYVPRMYDTEALMTRMDEFIQVLKDHGIEEQKAREITDFLIENNGNEEFWRDTLGDTVLAPGADAIHERGVLGKIPDAALAKFLISDPTYVLTSYIHETIKRGEWEARFGDRVQGPLLVKQSSSAGDEAKSESRYDHRYWMDRMLASAREEGASPMQLRHFNRVSEAYLGRLGAKMDPRLRAAMSGVALYETARLLPMAAVSNMVDVANVVLRSNGDLASAWKGMKAALKAYREQYGNALWDQAITNGLVADSITANAIAQRLESPYLSGRIQIWSEKFFRLIGMQQLTNFLRLYSLATGHGWIEKLARREDAESNRHLKALGISAELVHSAQGGDLEAQHKVQLALNQFVQESVFHPDATQRPAWASDPHWMLIWQLKQFMWSFYDVILKRFAREFSAADGVRRKAMVTAVTFLPLLALAFITSEIRELLKYGLLPWREGKPEWKNPSRWDEAMTLLDRAGVLGPFAVVWAANRSTEHGGLFITDVMGPTASHFEDLVRDSLATSFFKGLPLISAFPEERALARDTLLS